MQKLLFAGSRFQLAQLPLADCGRYQSCTDCVLARDPYCAWSRNASLCVRIDGLNGYGGSPGREGHPNVAQGPPFTSVTSSRRSHLVQDVLSSDTRACTLPQVAKQGETPPPKYRVELGGTCEPPPNFAPPLPQGPSPPKT